MSEVNLPERWVEITINYFVNSMIGGASPTVDDYSSDGVLALNKGDIKALGKIELKKNVKRVPIEFSKKHENKVVNTGAVIVTLRDLSQKADFLGLISEYRNEEEALITQGMYALSLTPGFSKKYLINYSNSLAYREQVKDVKVGFTQVHLRNEQFLNLKIPLAPLAEQQQIAQKLDELLAQVDTLKTRLDAIPKILKRFRQSVLAAAVSGRLTEEWRGSAEYSANDLNFEIPASWSLQTIDDIAHVKGGKRLPKGDELVEVDTGYRYIRAGQLKNGTIIDGSDARNKQLYISQNVYEQIKRYTISEGDAYLTIVGASIGDAGITPKKFDGANLTENAAKICEYKQPTCSTYVGYWLRSQYVQDLIQAEIKSGAQGKLALMRIKTLPFPKIPLEEQTEIVRRVEQFFVYADQIEQRVKDAQARVNHLTQSILAKAFRGELTADWRAQNPDLISGENSAAALLERIKAAREATAKPKRKIKA